MKVADRLTELNIDGSELHSIYAVTRIADPYIDSIKNNKHRTLIGYDPRIGQVIRLSIVFLLVSVVLPLSLLIMPPPAIMSEPLSLWATFIIEISLLTASILIIVPLLELLLKQLSGESGDNLSPFSDKVVWLVNYLAEGVMRGKTSNDSDDDLPPQSGGASDSYDCDEFDNQRQAQDYYENNNPDKDPSSLDADDGEACEEPDY